MNGELPFRLRLLIGIRESDWPWNAKLVAFIVVSYMNDAGVAWPKRHTIASDGSISYGSVYNALSFLTSDEVGFLHVTRKSATSTPRYRPQLTPELEKLVDAYLARARERSGQLELPQDGRGLSVAPSPGDQAPSPGDQAPSPGDHEVDSEVVDEIGTAAHLEDVEDLEDPLVALVVDLADRDANTLKVFRHRFGSLSTFHIEHAHDELRRRRKNTGRAPLTSEARYAFSALKRRALSSTPGASAGEAVG